MDKINAQQLPVKAHYFFFMAAMGPILPFLPVYGKQLGVSALVMGGITSVLPLLFLVAKPMFGFLVDRYRSNRRSIFIGLLALTSTCFVLMYFLPVTPAGWLPVDNSSFSNVSCSDVEKCTSSNRMNINPTDYSDNGQSTINTCVWNCSRHRFNTTVKFYGNNSETNRLNRNASCIINTAEENWLQCREESKMCNVSCDRVSTHEDSDYYVYGSVAFWGFVVLMSLGNIGFNVSNCISDAICFDVLGEGGQMSYGRQRVWGSIGFGLTAFLAGYAMDWWSGDDLVKSYTPAFILILVFTSVDLFFCTKLELPVMSSPDSILKDVLDLLRIKPIAIFICFATIVGIVDSFMIYFLFWYMEDLAQSTGHMNDIKMIEGLTVFAETLGGEVITFMLSGKILKKIGYGWTFIFCFFCYALRLSLISLAPNPWWIVFSEFFMQGPSYALCYTAIVAYASAVAPAGTSATVQGIVAGMDDGLGFAIGSLIGGVLYKRFGGSITLKIYASLAFVTSIVYAMLHLTYLRHLMPKTDTRKDVEWKSPEEAAKRCGNADDEKQ